MKNNLDPKEELKQAKRNALLGDPFSMERSLVKATELAEDDIFDQVAEIHQIGYTTAYNNEVIIAKGFAEIGPGEGLETSLALMTRYGKMIGIDTSEQRRIILEKAGKSSARQERKIEDMPEHLPNPSYDALVERCSLIAAREDYK